MRPRKSGRVNVIHFPSPAAEGAATKPVQAVAGQSGHELTIVEGGKSGRIVELWQDDLLVCALTRDENGIWAVASHY